MFFAVIELARRSPGRRSGLERLNRDLDGISLRSASALDRRKPLRMGAGVVARGTTFRARDKHVCADMIYLNQIDTLIRTSHLPVIQRQRRRYLLVKGLGSLPQMFYDTSKP